VGHPQASCEGVTRAISVNPFPAFPKRDS